MTELLLSFKWNLRICTSHLIESSKKPTLSAWITLATIWLTLNLIQEKEMLLSVLERIVGDFLWNSLLKLTPKNSELKKIKWCKNYGVIITLMPQRRYGEMKPMTLSRNHSLEHLLSSLWHQSILYVDQFCLVTMRPLIRC